MEKIEEATGGASPSPNEDIVSVAGVKMLEGLLPALENHSKLSEKNAESMARIADAFERIAKTMERAELNMQHIIEQQFHAVR